MFSYIAKSVSNYHLGSTNDPCYIQNRVITNRVIKRLKCIFNDCVFIMLKTLYFFNFDEHVRKTRKSALRGTYTPGWCPFLSINIF